MTLPPHNKHLGSSFDDFLAEEDLLADVEAVAFKGVLAYQLEQEMKVVSLSKTDDNPSSQQTATSIIEPTNKQ